MMSLLVVGLLAVAAALLSIARRTSGHPPLWRSKLAFAAAAGCLAVVVFAAIAQPRALLETPLLIVAAFCLYEGGLALMSLVAASGRPAPKWLL